MENKVKHLDNYDIEISDDDVAFSINIEDLLKPVNPSEYFITSGEAVEKSKRLDKDIWKLAGDCRKFLNFMKKVKGKAEYLEIGWEGGVLIMRRKDSRRKKKLEKKLKNQ